MKSSRPAIPATLVFLLLLLPALPPVLAQERPLSSSSVPSAPQPSAMFLSAPLPFAAEIHPLAADRGAGLPTSSKFPSIAVDSGLGGSLRLQPRLEDSLFPFGIPGEIADKVLRIEALALLPGGPDYTQRSPETLLDELGAILSSVESLTGLEYWSASRGKMRLLYESVYKIDSVSERRPVNSPTKTESAALEPGRNLEFLALQKDTSFGANVFAYSLGRGGESLMLKSENLTVMRYLLLPFVNPGKMQSLLWVIPCREGLLLYFIMTIESVNFAAERVFESTGNRALALLGWLAREASAAGFSEKIDLPVNMKAVESLKD